MRISLFFGGIALGIMDYFVQSTWLSVIGLVMIFGSIGGNDSGHKNDWRTKYRPG